MTWVQEVHSYSFSLAGERLAFLSPSVLSQAKFTYIWGPPLLPGPSVNAVLGTVQKDALMGWQWKEAALGPRDQRQHWISVTETGRKPHAWDDGQKMPAGHWVGRQDHIDSVPLYKCPPCVKNTMTDTKVTSRATVPAGSRDLRTPHYKHSWSPASTSCKSQ